MKKTLLTFTLLAGLSSCTNLSEDLDMIGTQNIILKQNPGIYP